jgi:hypothetical protein
MATTLILDLPLILSFKPGGYLAQTDYWNTEMCRRGFYYMVHNNGIFSLLVPEIKINELIKELQTAESVIITRGTYKNKDDCFEIVFDDKTETPYSIMLEDEQFHRASPLTEGWHGKLFIYYNSYFESKLTFDKVYYRVKDVIPCYDPVET